MIDPYQPTEAELLDRLCHTDHRVLVVGESGSGKTTLIRRLVTELTNRGRNSYCLNCDPGMPGFGVPGTLTLARLDGDDWSILASEPLCTLDAGRFRMPLVMAVNRLLARLPRTQQTPETQTPPLFLDSPGLVRGVGGAELLQALAATAHIDLCLVLAREGHPLPLHNELASLPARVITITSSPQAHPVPRTQRMLKRSQLWNEHLGKGHTVSLAPEPLTLLGTPPPLDNPRAWRGRQVALFHQGELQTLGEVQEASPTLIQVKAASRPVDVDQLLVRDAVYRDNRLHTAPKKPPAPDPTRPIAAGATEVKVELGALTNVTGEPQVAVRVGNTVATLVNGVTGDPLLQLRMLHQGRSLLFDIGDTGRMPLRAAHQISDVFISHAHADHIGGFLWLVRCRIGHYPPCRLFGPPGLHKHVSGMVSGILWDRVEDRAPKFIVHEWYEDHLKRWQVTAGETQAIPLETLTIRDGVVHQEAGFAVRATQLDHGVPVMAYAYEPRCQPKVRGDQLDGLEKAPGEKVVYATDFRDSPENVRKLSELARDAHTLFCEASFLLADRDQAERTQHLTTETCARIANLADVRQLVAFHFSHRYEKQQDRVYEELRKFTDRLVVPQKSTPLSG
ncbi:Clp1/GlmU family protein [uncultured Marinobacter sp.]|uniref:Clp1/GlmU family protein n=1 Tax=uncultured Marinobacter sp. TaxID=187379 RepID=UPI002637A4CF|nr:Clp1/GlmU family protein [uncultured Marinobacter sp.]